MKIGAVYLEAIKWTKHEGIHVSCIDDRETAFIIRDYINDALNRLDSIASVVINEPNEGNQHKYDILIYGETRRQIKLEIINELKAYHIFE